MHVLPYPLPPSLPLSCLMCLLFPSFGRAYQGSRRFPLVLSFQVRSGQVTAPHRASLPRPVLSCTRMYLAFNLFERTTVTSLIGACRRVSFAVGSAATSYKICFSPSLPSRSASLTLPYPRCTAVQPLLTEGPLRALRSPRSHRSPRFHCHRHHHHHHQHSCA